MVLGVKTDLSSSIVSTDDSLKSMKFVLSLKTVSLLSGSRYSRPCPVSSSITAPAKNFLYAHSFSWGFELFCPSPFVILLLLIVKSGMDAVSFVAKYVMWPSCLSCADNILLLLAGLLEDVSWLMAVLLVFDT